MYLTQSDKLAARHDAQSSDAAERLAIINDARKEALSKITAALDEFIETVDRERVDGRDVPEIERRTFLAVAEENLHDISLAAVVSCEDKQLGEGVWNMLSGDNDNV